MTMTKFESFYLLWLSTPLPGIFGEGKEGSSFPESGFAPSEMENQ